MTHAVEVIRIYLELREPEELRPAPVPPGNVRIEPRRPCTVQTYRRLYRAVGEPWHWRDRLAWSDEALQRHLDSPDVMIWELLVDDQSAGFFELRRSAPREVEIAYFGLVPQFIGRGLGGALLTRAAEEAWALGASRVWLHTCTLDSPHALPNYRARGFREYKTERYETML
jgi:GNAT superfamily N-acetyltransferase